MATNQLLIAFSLCPALMAQSQLVLDRGLPTKNLNNDSGVESRSNVRWTWDEGLIGDDLAVGRPGERWVIDRIRVWTVPGGKNLGDPDYLGDVYRDVRLYFGSERDGLSPIMTGTLELGSNTSSNRSISIREATTGTGSALYEDFGHVVRVWEIEFSGLNLVVDGGKSYLFASFGLGRKSEGAKRGIYPWFAHASNSSLGGSPADGADQHMQLLKAAGDYATLFQGAGKGWNKDSDINVQVYATRLDEAR